MKTFGIVLFAVLVSGCAQSEYETICETDIVGLAGGNYPNLSCERLTHNLALAKKYMMREYTLKDGSKYRPIKDEEEWKYFFSGVSVWVSHDPSLEDPWSEDGELYGYYDGMKGEVQLQIDQRSLVHELFHRIDSMRLQPGTMYHENWENNGHMLVVGFYHASYRTIPGTKRDSL